MAAAEGFSIAGLTGTAHRRLTDDSASGLLRVKIGSLDQVTAMTGTVSRTNDGALSFALIVNDPANYHGAKEDIDAFITKLPEL